MSSHLSLATRPVVLPPTCKLTFLDFSKFNNSWKSCLTLWLVFAEVSMKLIPQLAACACPSDVLTFKQKHLFTKQKTERINAHFSQFRTFIALISHQHDGNLTQIRSLYFPNQFPNRFQFLQTLSTWYGIYQYECVAFADWKALHCWKLMWTGCVCYLQRAYVFVATYHLKQKVVQF